MSDQEPSQDQPDDDSKLLKLQVANARPEDSGRGLARKQATPARAVLPYPEDEGLDFVRLDGLQRANAGVGAGDFVEIQKVESKPAKKVVFAPAQKDLRLQGNGTGLKRSFMGRPLKAGDFVATHGQQQVDRSDMARPGWRGQSPMKAMPSFF